MGQSEHPLSTDQMVYMGMTADAALRFAQAITYGEALAHAQAEANDAPATKRKIEEHCEWLRWGSNRIRYALEKKAEAQRVASACVEPRPSVGADHESTPRGRSV